MFVHMLLVVRKLANSFLIAVFVLAQFSAYSWAQEVIKQPDPRAVAIEQDSGNSDSSQHRIALVVGINSYPKLSADEQLNTAINDGKAIATSLKSIGFQVIYGENLSQDNFEDKFLEFQNQITKNSIALVYFAGHGVAFKTGNYLLPSDVTPPKTSKPFEETTLVKRSIPEADLVEGMMDAGADVSIIIIDACRNNPLKTSDKRSLGNSRGLTRTEFPKGVFAIYSAGYGQTALDRLPNESNDVNSVFTRVLLKHLPRKGMELKDLASETGDEVDQLASKVSHEQSPAYYDQVRGRKVFLAGTLKKLPPKEVVIQGAEVTTNLVTEPDKVDDFKFEFAMWESIKDSEDRIPFDAYIARYPFGTFVAIAKQKIAAIEQRKTANEIANRAQKDEEDHWKSIENSTNAADFYGYIKKYPNGKYFEAAKVQIDSIRNGANNLVLEEEVLWNTIKKFNDLKLFQDFLNKYPNGKYADLAKGHIRDIEGEAQKKKYAEEFDAWRRIEMSNRAEDFEAYAGQYPTSVFVDISRSKAAAIRELANKVPAVEKPITDLPDVIVSPPKRPETSCKSITDYSSSDQPLRQTLAYYADLNDGNVNCAVSRRSKRTSKVRRLISEMGGAVVEEVYSRSTGSQKASVDLRVSVWKHGGQKETYNIRAKLELISGDWLISSLENM